jgi:Acyl-CoA synthetases (AMP-forming)/AMP-acid ligases II
MTIDFLLDDFHANPGRSAIVWKDVPYTYGWLVERVAEASGTIKKHSIESGDVVALIGDFTPNSIALLLALVENGNIIVPLCSPLKDADRQKLSIAQVEKMITIDYESDTPSYEALASKAAHPMFDEIRSRKAPGLVLFTSGTSGAPKGAVHDFSRLLEKFKTKRKALKTINFLLWDHWGGLNTLFHTLSNCGVVLPVKSRQPDEVCEFIERYKIELLPVSPTFLNLLILSEAYKKYDMSSLQLITYGTEPMPPSTLAKSRAVFTGVKFQQTYGLIELGVLRSKSRDDDSLWVKIGGEGFETRVVDSILQIKADSAMLGYLNAPSPFTEDGYFITGDMVEQDGEYLKILGRKSELINVGGEKVYPQEVEDVILQFPGIKEVTVFGEKNQLVGNIVCAKVFMAEGADPADLASRIKIFCRARLDKFKVPVKVMVVDSPLYGDRFKKMRS